jgi:two-component sensor histidine kinase/tetratricopeptide (TPR) repeat protein
MRYRWLSFALLILTIPAIAQRLDSLHYKYQQSVVTKDRVKQGFYLSEIGKYYYKSSNPDSSFHYYIRAKQIHKGVKNDTMLAYNLNDLGNLYKDKSNIDSALVSYLDALAIFEKLSLKIKIAYAKTNLTRIYKDIGAYDKALDLGLSAERIFENYPGDPNHAICLNAIGSVYGKQREYYKSLKYYRKALVLWEKAGEQDLAAIAVNNIGNVYMNLGKYDSAFIAFHKSFQIRETLPITRSTARVLNNLGEVSIKVKRFEDAEKYLLKSLSIKKQLNDKLGEVVTLNNLADYRIQKSDWQAAEQYLNQADQLEKSIGGILEERRKNLVLRVTLNRAIKNFKKASDYAEELLLVKDSLLDIEKTQALADMQIKYETESKEQQIKVLHTEQELNKAAIQARNFWITALIIAITSILAIAILIYYSFRVARKGRERVEVLMKELHHRVKNNLQVLTSVLSLQSQHLTDENALLSIKSTESRINAMALIHRKLYSDDRNTIVSTRGYFRELIEFLMSSYGYNERNLKLKADIDEVELDVDKAIPLGLIVNELLSNAFKHAFGKQGHPELTIDIKQHDNELHAVIRDNGHGTAELAGEEAKFGMRMVTILTNDLRGKFKTSVTNGTEHSVIIPLT